MPRAPADSILSSHRSPVTCVIFHPSFPVMVSGSEDATIKLWDYETGEYERTLKGHTDTVNSIDFEPVKGKYLASSSADMTIKIWDFTSADFECLKTLKGHDHNVSSVRFLNSDSIVSASRDKTIKIWQVESGFCTKTLDNGHQDWIRKVMPSPCRKLMASCSNDQTIKVWDVEKFDIKYDLRDHEHVVEDVIWANFNSYQYIESAVSSNTNQANGDASSLPNGTSSTSSPSMSSPISSSSNNIVNNGASISNDQPVSQRPSRYLVSASRDKSIKFWDINNSSVLFTLMGHDNWVRQLRFMPHGRFLLSCADDKSIKSLGLGGFVMFVFITSYTYF